MNLAGPAAQYVQQVRPSDVPNPLNAKMGMLGNPALALAIGAGGALVVGGVALGVALHRRNDKSSGRATERFRGVTGSAKQYAKTGGGDVRYTKKGQPYVITADGRAKFIKR